MNHPKITLPIYTRVNDTAPLIHLGNVEVPVVLDVDTVIETLTGSAVPGVEVVDPASLDLDDSLPPEVQATLKGEAGLPTPEQVAEDFERPLDTAVLAGTNLPPFEPAASLSDAVGPHSRSCGVLAHMHGDQCRKDCPTCYTFNHSEQGPYLVSPHNPALNQPAPKTVNHAMLPTVPTGPIAPAPLAEGL